ncbi:fibronectin type III-like domain-contianing protein [Maribacter sp. LLG6340-A2]|uniref:fibronectin type III-like domain-contianing protein n=1 Tax=Maribacter sp. LLG6340-A2 TaxID=3160834 RepID=UPI00386FE445
MSVVVKNIGYSAGDEGLQFYVHNVLSSVTRYIKESKGFECMSLKQGETKTVSFTLPGSKFIFYDKS